MIIDYNMTRDYCSDWSPIDAIREMVQNASDNNYHSYFCQVDDKRITVTTTNVGLPLNTLMLGQSVKDSGAAGKYGEGYKIGMLVLTRAGLNPKILSGGDLITGSFIKNQFGLETFNITVEDSPMYSDNITFVCDTGDIDLEELKHKLPAFTGTNPLRPKFADIWQDKPGCIYVNGLFVTETDLVFGYNFSPSKIELNRDRNMVDGVHWQLAAYFNSLGKAHAKTIFNLIERDAPDVRDLSYRLHDKNLQAELARLFFNKYGEGAKIGKPGGSYYGGSGYISCGTSSARTYSKCGIKEVQKVADPDAPDQVLEIWYEQNKKRLRRDTRESLSKVITRAKGWSKAGIY